MSMSTRPIESHITCKCSPIKLSTKVAYPQSRFKHASCLHENFVYIFAGKDGNISLKDFWRLNIVSLKWECVNFRGDNPQHLEGHTLVSCKKLLLLFGGQFGDSLTESSLWIINPDLGYIRRSVPDAGSDRPCVRRHHSAVVYNSAMYIYGGYIDMKGSSSELWRYHVDDEEWELISPHQQSRDLPGGRHGHSCIVYNKHMYLYGGNTDLTPKQDLWCYSFGVNRWDRIKSKYGPPSLIGHTASLVGTRMFIFGGETNQQPVNNLWYFCFKTQKWTQIMLRDQIPARTFHSGHFVSASHQHDSSLKASSVPYLQKKMSRLNVDRPRSSPGVRLGSTESRSLRNLSELDRDLHKVTSVSQSSLLNESETKRICSTHESEPIQKPNVLKLNSQDSTESIKLEPSPSENTADKSPLCPKHTDINYNAIDALDRNTVIRGLDNPGISDSTEELIRENCAIRTRSRSDIFCDSNKNNNSSAFNRSLSYTTELERKKDLLHRNSESNISLRYVSRDTVISDETLDTFCVKKTRLDPELVIEDLEFLDCFPNDVKIQYPRQLTLRVSRTSSESTLYDTDTLETIFLDDISEQRRSKTPPRFVKNGFESVKFEKDTNAIQFQGGKSELAEKYKNVKNNEISTVLNERREFRDNFDNQRKTMPSDMETCFPGKPLHTHSESQRNETRNVPRANKSIATELPYILVFGGKDSTTVNFTVKPLPVWKLQISSL